MEHRVTIKEIAAEAGVSTGTVHRALYGKKGLSEQTRQQILDLCARRGYRANSAASALKRSALRIAAAFPGPQEENSYFYGSVWHGFRRCMAELDDYNLEVLELPYYPGTERGQAETLNACFEQYGGKIDALLTIGPTEDTARRAVQRYSSAGTPVFFACDDAEGCGRIACVQADHDMAGRIAAELLSAQLSPGDAVLLCAGDVHTPSHYRMAAGFEAYLRGNSVPLTLVRADGYHDKQELALRLRRTLAEDACISGAFSVSARLSVLLADAVAQMGRAGQVRVVASDLFGETVRNMEEGLVQNILYKDPAQQGYLAARLMGDFVLRGIQPPAGVHYVESRVIFKSSLAYYRASGAVCP